MLYKAVEGRRTIITRITAHASHYNTTQHATTHALLLFPCYLTTGACFVGLIPYTQVKKSPATADFGAATANLLEDM